MSDSSQVEKGAPTKLDLKFANEPLPLFPVANSIQAQLQPTPQLWRTEQVIRCTKAHATKLTIEFYDSASSDLTQREALERKLIKGKLYQEQCTAIGQAIENGEFNLLEALKVRGNDGQTSSWDYKLKNLSSDGQHKIYQDLQSLIETICRQMQEHISVVGQDLTLALPPSHLPYLLEKVGSHCSVLELLQLSLPAKLRIVAIPELTTKQGHHALLVCKHKAFGPAGYFAIGAQANIVFEDDVATKTKLFVPVYGLVITNPEQIAVLTGI